MKFPYMMEQKKVPYHQTESPSHPQKVSASKILCLQSIQFASLKKDPTSRWVFENGFYTPQLCHVQRKMINQWMDRGHRFWNKPSFSWNMWTNFGQQENTWNLSTYNWKCISSQTNVPILSPINHRVHQVASTRQRSAALLMTSTPSVAVMMMRKAPNSWAKGVWL